MTAPVPPDHEVVYRLLQDRQWAALLDFVYRHRATIPSDPLLAQAVTTFVATFQAVLPAEEPALGDELERLFLLHTGGFFRLPEAFFGEVVAALVRRHAGQPERAVGYARHAPAHPVCAAVLEAHGPPLPVPHEHGDAIEWRVQPAAPAEAAVTSLFRSAQERDFFLAAREVFAAYLPYPNVALAAVLDYDRLHDRLSPAERRYFFSGRVDLVVFDQHDDYRPRYFFELDSPLHDEEARRRRDRHKERILALAGQTLHRIRHHGRRTGPADFVPLLRAVAASR